MHFLLYTPQGSLVMVVAAAVGVGVVVWYAVALAGAMVGTALWRLWSALVAATRAYRPPAKS